MGTLCGYARRFRPHPALARHLPHPGEGGMPVPDEGEIGEWNRFTQPSAAVAFPFKGETGERTVFAAQFFRTAQSANGFPPHQNPDSSIL